MHLFIASLALAVGLLAPACKSPSADHVAAPPPAAAHVGVWTVAAIDGAPVIAGSPAALELTGEGRLAGNASVNRIMASYTLEGEALTLSEVASTMMAGPQDLMQQEQRLLAALGRVRSAKVEGGALVLRDAAGAELVRAVRR